MGQVQAARMAVATVEDRADDQAVRWLRGGDPA